MTEFKHREISSTVFLGERVDFIASNERVQDRVENLSYEYDVIQTLVNDLKDDDVVWDLGACLGIHSFILAKHLDDGMVYSCQLPHPTSLTR